MEFVRYSGNYFVFPMRYFGSLTLRLIVVLMLIVWVPVPVFAANLLCSFRAKGLNLSFGLINPSIAQTISSPITFQTAFANQAGDCNGGGNMMVSIVGSSTRQLVSGANVISYTISGFPIVLPKPGNAPPGNPGKGYVTWFTPGQLQGTILWNDYANAPAGSYTDNFTISVDP